MIAFLDTDVLIDYLRGTPPAQTWFSSISASNFQIPGIVAMELLMGCRNRTELRRIQKFLHTFHIVWPEAAEFAKAYQMLGKHRLANNLGIPDCLIAAMALSRAATLYTFNLKHFRVIKGLDAKNPYTRI